MPDLKLQSDLSSSPQKASTLRTKTLSSAKQKFIGNLLRNIFSKGFIPLSLTETCKNGIEFGTNEIKDLKRFSKATFFDMTLSDWAKEIEETISAIPNGTKEKGVLNRSALKKGAVQAIFDGRKEVIDQLNVQVRKIDAILVGVRLNTQEKLTYNGETYSFNDLAALRKTKAIQSGIRYKLLIEELDDTKKLNKLRGTSIYFHSPTPSKILLARASEITINIFDGPTVQLRLKQNELKTKIEALNRTCARLLCRISYYLSNPRKHDLQSTIFKEIDHKANLKKLVSLQPSSNSGVPSSLSENQLKTLLVTLYGTDEERKERRSFGNFLTIYNFLAKQKFTSLIIAAKELQEKNKELQQVKQSLIFLHPDNT